MKNVKKIVCFAAMVFCFVVMTGTMTVLGANTVTCNHNWVLAESEGAPCSGYTYIYACPKCLANKTEKTEATQAHKWVNTASAAATCEKDGYIQAYCEVCFDLKSETIKAFGHRYTYASNNDATCTKDGTLIRKCHVCEETDIVPDIGSAKGHDFADVWLVVVPSTCLEKGVSKRVCEVCNAGEFRYEELGAHKDNNGDRKCDVCSESLSIFDSVVPDSGSDEDKKDCSCNCHKGGIKGFFWKIGNFFCKLFRIKSKQVCDCGVYHY